MRRVSRIAALCRAVDGAAAVEVPQYRMSTAAQFSTSSNKSSARSNWLFNNLLTDLSARTAAHAVAGTMLFSVAANTLTEEVHAKEAVPPELRPTDLVLYQYEACPFCNKVKGIHFFLLLLLFLSFLWFILYLLICADMRDLKMH